MKKTNRKSGFTLVELMVVAAIIAILAAIIIPMLTKNKEAAVAADGKNMIGACINAAKAQYARIGGEFITDPANLDDADMVTDYNNGRWDIEMDGPSPATAVATLRASYQGFDDTSTVTLDANGNWTDALVKE